jgi:hypothetical protein
VQRTRDLGATRAVDGQRHGAAVAGERAARRSDELYRAGRIDNHQMRLVVVDDLANLGADRVGHVLDRRETGQARGDALDSLELPGPTRFPDRNRLDHAVVAETTHVQPRDGAILLRELPRAAPTQNGEPTAPAGEPQDQCPTVVSVIGPAQQAIEESCSIFAIGCRNRELERPIAVVEI